MNRAKVQNDLAHWILGRVDYDDLTDDARDILVGLSAEVGYSMTPDQSRDLLRHLATTECAVLRDAIRNAAQVLVLDSGEGGG